MDSGVCGQVKGDHELHAERGVARLGFAALSVLLLAFGVVGARRIAPYVTNDAEAGERVLRVDYDRAGHFNQPMNLRVHVSGAATQDRLVRVWMDAGYLQTVEVAQISPAPVAVEGAPDQMIYVFNVSQPHRPAEFTFTLKPSQVGEVSGHAGLVGGPAVAFSQFIDP